MIIDSLIPIVSIVGREGNAEERPDRDLSRKRIVCYWRDVRLCMLHPKYSDIHFIFIRKS